MLNRRSVLSASLVMAVVVATAGQTTSAFASPNNGKRYSKNVQTEHLVDIDHRHRHGGGWTHGHGWHRDLGPRQIRRSLRHRGFHKIRILDRRGPVYVVKARGWRGMPVRLIVDARTADIVRSRPMGPRFNWSYRW